MEKYLYIKNKLKKMSFQRILKEFQICNCNFKILYIKLKRRNNYLKKKRYIITRIE